MNKTFEEYESEKMRDPEFRAKYWRDEAVSLAQVVINENDIPVFKSSFVLKGIARRIMTRANKYD